MTEGDGESACATGYASYAKMKYQKSISDYTEAIRLKPDYADAYNHRGNVYSKKEEYDKAISDCTEAIRLKPDYADAYLNRGNVYSKKEEYDEAIIDYTEA